MTLGNIRIHFKPVTLIQRFQSNFSIEVCYTLSCTVDSYCIHSVVKRVYVYVIEKKGKETGLYFQSVISVPQSVEPQEQPPPQPLPALHRQPSRQPPLLQKTVLVCSGPSFTCFPILSYFSFEQHIGFGTTSSEKEILMQRLV